MKTKMALAGAAAIALSSIAGTASAEFYRPGLLGVNTDLGHRSAPPPPRPVSPAPMAPAPNRIPMPRNVDIRPLPPRPLIERPAPAPVPSPAPRVNTQLEPGEHPSQGMVKVDVPLTPKTSITGTATGTLNLPPNEGTPTLDGGTVGVSHETK
jgi:hypothetical protein